MATDTIDPFEDVPLSLVLLARAARGDRGAQREGAARAARAMASGTVAVTEAVPMLEVFSRMAASHGDQDDKINLAYVLLDKSARTELELSGTDAAGCRVEAAMLLDEAADQGSDLATNVLMMMADAGEPPEIFDLAKKSAHCLRHYKAALRLESLMAGPSARLFAGAPQTVRVTYDRREPM